MLHPYPPLLPQSVVERARKLSVPLLLDGVKKAGLELPRDGCMTAAIGPVERGMKVVGTAMTVDTQNGDNFSIHVAAYSAPAEGYVMVIDGKAYEDRAYLGDLIMGACQAIGFAGIVVDGYTRDRDGNIGLGFPVFSRGFLPRAPGKGQEGEVNAVIQCGGVTVTPGDLVMGDSDGVCVIPSKYIDQVLDEAEKKHAYEVKREETIAAYRKAKAEGAPLPQLAPQWVLDMLENQSN